ELAQIASLLHRLRDALRGGIGRAVIDVDDLVIPAAIERGADLLDQRRDVVGLIAHGDNDGNRKWGRRQIGARGWDSPAAREPGAASSRFYGAGGLWATLLRCLGTAPGSGRIAPSARMAKPSRRAANQ